MSANLRDASSGPASPSSAAPQDERVVYTTKILRLAASLPLTEIVAPDGVGEARSATCGSRIRTCVTRDGDRVSSVAQEVQACAFGQASAALVQAGVSGRSLGEIEEARSQVDGWLNGRRDDPGAWPGLVALAPARAKTGRHGAMLLPFDALIAALRNVRP